MEYRKLTDKLPDVSTIGFGTWGIGNWKPGQLSYGPTDDKQSLAALETAQQQGINFYDTARLYGEGHAERLLGQAFSSIRESVLICTKYGYTDFKGTKNYSRSFLTTALSDSLKNLKTDYIDLLQLHDIETSELRDDPSIIESLQQFQQQGKVKSIGVSTKTPQTALEIITEFEFDVVEINFSLLDLRALACDLFKACEARGIGIIAKTPLCFGFLTGMISRNHQFPDSDHRSRWPIEQVNRWITAANSLLAHCPDPTDQLSDTQKALRFCKSYPQITCAIPGMLSPEEVLNNSAVLNMANYTKIELDELQSIYQRQEIMSRG